jgi:vacuolar-type H+-ATPase subunit I/STV1
LPAPELTFNMTPERLEIIYGRTAFAKRKALFKLLFIVWSHSSSDVSTNFLLNATPALFTRISIVSLPNFSIADLTRELTSEGMLTSHFIPKTLELLVSLLISSTVEFISLWVLEQTTTFTDFFANIMAVSLPIPLPLPVIIAVFLDSCFIRLLYW